MVMVILLNLFVSMLICLRCLKSVIALFVIVAERGRWVKININVNEFRYLPDETFRMHFRMSRPVFEVLAVWLDIVLCHCRFNAILFTPNLIVAVVVECCRNSPRTERENTSS